MELEALNITPQTRGTSHFGSALLSTTIALCLLATLGNQVFAQEPQEADEYEAKTAFVYAFAKFVSWPGEGAHVTQDSFVIGTMAGTPFARSLASLLGKRIHDRPVQIRELDDASHFEPCQVMLFGLRELQLMFATEPHLAHAVLTIGEDDGFAEAGGVLQLTFVDEHLGFIVNRAAARRAGLELSASLYNLAQRIIDDDGRNPHP
jgi:hypothetical protein